MTQRHAPILLLTALLAAGPALAQTAAPLPAGPATPSAGSADMQPAPVPAAPTTETTAPQAPGFTPVPVDDPMIPAPIAARAVPPDYSAPPPAKAATPAAASTPAPASASTSDGVASAATPPDQDAADGTSPGSAGSSGWTGGVGGSTIGTNPSGAVPESQTWQPPTARGLDLKG